MQALHPQHRCRGSCRLKARASYVDESLFGSPVGTRPTVPGFDPPWVQKTDITRAVGARALQSSPGKGTCETTRSEGSTPALMPRKKNRYRLISHTPSYCDESLFGSHPGGTSWEASRLAKQDAVRLHSLFWTPPTTPRGSDSPRPRETPLCPVHPRGSSVTQPRLAADSRGLSPRPLRRERSHSLTCLHVPSTGHPASSAPHTNGPQDPRPPRAGVTFRSPLVTPRAHSVSASVPATPQRGRVPQNPKPPWK
ncbi:RBPJ-interacting and tubulin-associated protein 1 [Fukomys damarensis]|uniref:RBPJ-interacting and tubulin-associated protein 1 n=1 Tax=Fukomys damarensis TaxID=885580 RepID=A0A091CXX1_FUKDA|nr:RBPJ-interacting and tubulin-associated protein 1 [Fukomys damarensis]KFO23587.1 RBPJ-interacting and tubulin-associated protein [Fukomys damarensis]